MDIFDSPEVKAWIAEVNAAADAGDLERTVEASIALGRSIRIAKGAARGVTICPRCGYGMAGRCCPATLPAYPDGEEPYFRAT